MGAFKRALHEKAEALEGEFKEKYGRDPTVQEWDAFWKSAEKQLQEQMDILAQKRREVGLRN